MFAFLNDASFYQSTFWFFLKLIVFLTLVWFCILVALRKIVPGFKRMYCKDNLDNSKSTGCPYKWVFLLIVLSAVYFWFASWEGAFRQVQTINNPTSEKRMKEEKIETPVRPVTSESLQEKSDRMRSEAEKSRKETKEKFDKIEPANPK